MALETGTKNSKQREVPLLPRATAIAAKMPAHLRTDFLFVNAKRRDPAERKRKAPTRFNHLDRGLKAACRRAGVAEVRWHDLRRTCGVRLLRDHGMSMEQVSRWLGHSSVVVTERIYAFLEVEDLEKKLADNRRDELRRGRQDRRRPAQKRAHKAADE